jgi:hypothetical protein
MRAWQSGTTVHAFGHQSIDEKSVYMLAYFVGSTHGAEPQININLVPPRDDQVTMQVVYVQYHVAWDMKS